MTRLFEFGSFGPLLVRRVTIDLGLRRAVRLIYASDLHLGHWWTRPVPGQLQQAVADACPDIVLLGGDLVDRATALPQLEECVRVLSKVAPVWAIAGNHDRRAGIDRVRSAVLEGGGRWLSEAPLKSPVPIDACVRPTEGEGRILCAHYPDVFPEAARAGYRLVLAGHLHGGQCVLAVRGGRLHPACWVHRWHGLRFDQDGATMLVSRGLGDTFPFRINCPREVLLCDVS